MKRVLQLIGTATALHIYRVKLFKTYHSTMLSTEAI